MKMGSNMTVFILFFGLALVEAFQEQNWLAAALFLALGFASLYQDNKKKRK